MGLFKRLRAASTARKPPESSLAANNANANANATAPSVDGMKRSPSANLLSVPSNGPTPPPRVSTSSTVGSTSSSPSHSARSSMLPWKKDRRRADELQSIPYEATSASPLRGSGAHPPPSPTRTRTRAPPLIQHIPTITTKSPGTTPTRPPRSSSHSYSHYQASPPPSPSSPTTSRALHTRNASHESQRTVISLDSTFTGRSRRTSESTEWKQDGGVLGKFAFESGDWGAISAATPFQSPPASAGPSKHTTPGVSPSKLASAIPMSPTPKPKDKESNTKPTMRKLGASHTSPSLPSVSTFSSDPWRAAHSPEYPNAAAGDWPPPPPAKQQQAKEQANVAMVKGKGRKEIQKGNVTVEAKAHSPPQDQVKDLPKDEVEEIFTSTSEPDLDDKRRFWKPGMRTRRSSRTRPPEERPVSMSHVEPRPALRRPSSSLFHNPFGRTQSRVSLAFELDQQSPADDGSFQLKGFRHISGASDAEGGFSQYISLTKKDDRSRSSGQDRSTSASTIVPLRSATSSIPPPSPTAPPRPRPPSAAGSDSSQRVSVAAFRKGVRRPSSSVLIDDDDDDLPLSLSRAQIFEGGGSGLRRDSGSAVSLTDYPSPPACPKRSLPPTPIDNSRGTSPSPIGLGAPPPMRAANASPGLGFVVKGARRNLDAKDAKRQDTFGERLPSPAPVPAPIITASPKVTRPPRASSLSSAAEDALGVQRSPILTTSPAGISAMPMPPRAPSKSPPAPAPLKVPEPQATMEDLMINLPPRPDELPDEPTPRDTPNRGATLSPSFSIAFDEPLRRISGLWTGGTPDPSNDKEEAFDPTLVEHTLRDSHRGSGSGADSGAGYENRQSLYDRLAAATSAATSSVVSALPTSTPPEDRLYIPPVRTPSPPPFQAQSPTSERTASPIPMPPAMEQPPAPVPPMPHSSFGRVPRKAAERPRGPRSDKQGWASSSDEEDDDEKLRARPATSASTVTTRTAIVPRPQPAVARPPSSAIAGRKGKEVEVISDSEEDEPLKTLKTSRSRSNMLELRPVMSRSSHSGSSLQNKTEPPRPPSILKPTLTGNGNGQANGHVNGQANGANGGRSRTTSMQNGPSAAITPSASKWSLSSSPNDSPDSDDMSPPVRPISRPNSRHSARPLSRVSIARDSTADRTRPMPRTGSADPMHKLGRPKSTADLLPRNQSSDRLRAMPQSTTKMHQPSPRHPMAMVAANDARPTASPASSQSGLTGDSSNQQPMTPRSIVADPSRRSWADGRPRPDAETASVRARPATQFDWAAGAGAAGAQFPQYPPGFDPYGPQKQQIQAQWMAAAQRHFEDMWERASSVSNAQTAPHGGPSNMFQPTYGYSYNQPPPPMPQMPYGGYGGYGQDPYGGFGNPQVAFPGGMPMGGMQGMQGMPGGMPGMPGGMPGMGMQGMPPMGGGGGYAYGPGAQSVYGGEFGPPVAPSMRESVPGSPGGSPRQRARRGSGVTDIASGRPASMAHNLPSSSASVIGVPTSHYSAQRSTPPRRQPRRTSGLALSEVGGPPSSWRSSMGDDLETPRPKRVTNAS